MQYLKILFISLLCASFPSIKGRAVALGLLGLCACTPEPGSNAWCDDLVEKPKGEWTMSEAGEYAKSCIVKIEED